MKPLDRIAANVVREDTPTPSERAVSALLKPPAISYIRDLRTNVEHDPSFLTFYDRSVSIKIQSFLSKQGIFWEPDIFEKRFMKLVCEAIDRVKKEEK